MSHDVWFKVALTCLTNGTRVQNPRLYTSGLNPEPASIEVATGDLIAMTVEDFEDGYLRLHPVHDDESVLRGLERWGCSVCKHDHWVMIEFERVDDEYFRFISAKTVPLTLETLERVHGVSHEMTSWLETRPEPEFDWVLRIMLPVLPAHARDKLRERLER